MTRPIVKEPPAGSRLSAFVKWSNAEAATAKPFWQYTADEIRGIAGLSGLSDAEVERHARALRDLAACVQLNEDPRIWVYPPDFVRDFVVLPAIEERDGLEVADALRGTATLDRLVELECEAAWRGTPAHKRGTPAADDEAIVTLAIIAEVYRDYPSAKSDNARYERAHKRLGIDRNAIRRRDKAFRRRLGGASDDRRTALLAAVVGVQKLLDEFDALSLARLRQGKSGWKRA